MKKISEKSGGVVYTPKYVVNNMLDYIGYSGTGILSKHIIDNSCGDGAFLTAIVRRFIHAWRHKCEEKRLVRSTLPLWLQTYIHGIEIDQEAADKCIKNLNAVLEDEGIMDSVNWDIRVCNALECHEYDGLMDFVVGNPPYVRVHNIKGTDMYDVLKQYEFAKSGPTDLYLAFYELGFRMLKKDPTATLTYITPSGWTKGPAGKPFRDYILKHNTLAAFFDLGKERVFDGISTYPCITVFTSTKFHTLIYGEGFPGMCKWRAVSYDEAFINGELCPGSEEETSVLKSVNDYDGAKSVRVKNGFATLSDAFFVYDKPRFPGVEITVTKASTGEKKRCLYPYDTLGFIYPLLLIRDKNSEAYQYICDNEQRLKERTYDSKWYGFGRKQGIVDTYKKKVSVNSIVKTQDDLKVSFVPEGEGVYSGFYILFNNEAKWLQTYTEIIKALHSDEFLNYVRALKKHKSGGYYSFTSKQLEKYLNWKLGNEKRNNNTH